MNIYKAFLSIIILGAAVGGGYLLYQNYLAPVPQATPPAGDEAVPQAEDRVSAEGKVVPARQVSLAFDRIGRVAEVLVAEGEAVKAGVPLVRLESDALQAAQAQAQAALETAQANLQAARTRLEQARMAARASEAPIRATAWEEDAPDEFDQPLWYFEKDQQVVSARKEADSARAALEAEQANLQNVLKRASSADLLGAESRLADAQAAFLIAEQVLDRAKKANDRELSDQAQIHFDSAKSELDAAQKAYDRILDTQGALDVQEARVRLAVAQERYDMAMERLDALQTGERSLEVRLAEEAVKQAEAAVAEAKTALEAGRVALEETTLVSPRDGVVAKLDVEVGEVVALGKEVALLVDFSSWNVETTDLSETDVPLIKPGMSATITLDTFPDRTFVGKVAKIALVSEDTRGSITYTVTLDFDPADAPVRWGMTAFVEFELP